MTHARPMFPPRADKKTRCNSEQVSTCALKLQVETAAIAAAVSTPAAKSGVANASTCSRTEQVELSRCAATASRESSNSIPSAVPAENSTSGRSAGAPPEDAPDGPFIRTDVSPEDLLKALSRLRREAAAEIERLIDLLDEIGPDPDLEPAGDELEPSLGACEAHPAPNVWRTHKGIIRDSNGTQADWADAGIDNDCEGDGCFDDREGDEQQHGGEGERENDENSGDEHEPILGSFDRLLNQDHSWRQTEGGTRSWVVHNNSDAEVEHDGREPDADGEEGPDSEYGDTGIGDADGLLEQCSGFASSIVGRTMQVQ